MGAGAGDSSACRHWNGKPDQATADAHDGSSPIDKDSLGQGRCGRTGGMRELSSLVQAGRGLRKCGGRLPEAEDGRSEWAWLAPADPGDADAVSKHAEQPPLLQY
ncbi:hypothetical protein Apa02nite_087780 [Actinoplanes palleronii]|uniref:Uncharacterized protein n=1 Tax=Actinoplanes palleronii TaxID=113570 RepID=A0ABQ4BQZ7_9ACTN|nr:hypothetical protein Apa02nite_087780 [Actinoplanes palleronii]